jgi:glycine/serine hydroxymethyltransferase
MERIAGWISEILSNLGDAATEQRVRAAVAALASQFPLYAGRLEAADAAQHTHAAR